MNTLKFGNGEWYGKEGTILAYNDENYNYKPLPFNFERDSKATVINKDGLIETVGSDVPRIDYKDSAEGALLLEPQRTNLVTYSEDFSQWFKIGGATLTSNYSVSPDGTQNSSRMQMNVSDKFYINVALNGDISFAVYLKGVGQIRLRDNTSTGLKDVTLTSEWVRYELNFNATISNFQIEQQTGVSDFEIFGAQLEQGSYATSYIPTQGSAVTRLADSSTNCGSGTNIFSNTSAVWFIDFSRFVYDSSINTKSAALENSSGSEQIRFHFDYPSKTVRFRDAKNGLANIGGNIVTETNIRKKVALKIDGTTLRVFADGVKIGSDYTRPTGFDIDKMSLYSSGTNVFDIKFYNTSLTDAELQALTT